MNSVIDNVQHNYILNLIEQINSSDNPLIMWGAGNVANIIFDYLEKHNICVDAFWVDNKQYDKYRGIDVLDIEEVLERYPVFDVVVGHSRYDLVYSRCDKIKQIGNVFVFAGVAFGFEQPLSYSELCEQKTRFDNIYNRLKDDSSKKALLAYLDSMVTCDPQYILNYSNRYMNYFNNDVLSIGDNESILDIGAYDGDTLKLFLCECGGKFINYYAVEPDKKNYKKLVNFVNAEHNGKIQCYDVAAWNCSENLYFAENDQGSGVSSMKENINLVKAERMDNIIANQPVSFIKINTSEIGAAEALEGCEMLIKSNKPKIAVMVGFGIEQLLRVTEYMMTHHSEYSIFFRFISPATNRFVLYGLCE